MRIGKLMNGDSHIKNVTNKKSSPNLTLDIEH